MYYQKIICVSTYVSSYHVSTYVSSYVSTMYHRPPTVNTMYHPQWYVTRGWYNIILHSTCITMDRLSSQSIIDDTIWYITWYIMIHVSSKSTLIHWWYVVIHMYQPWTELIHRWYIVSTPPRLRVGGDYVDTLLIHWWYIDDTMYQPETVSQTTLMCGHIVDTWLIHCINSAHVAGWRRLCWYIVDT